MNNTTELNNMILRATNCLALVPYWHKAAAKSAIENACTAFYYEDAAAVMRNCAFVFEKAGVDIA